MADSPARVDALSACTPPGPVLTRVVAAAATSRTKASLTALPSPATRSVASDWNSTRSPSAEMAGSVEAPVALAAARPLRAETSTVVPVARSRR